MPRITIDTETWPDDAAVEAAGVAAQELGWDFLRRAVVTGMLKAALATVQDVVIPKSHQDRCAMIKAFGANMSQQEARDYLVVLGTHNPAGALTPEYGGLWDGIESELLSTHPAQNTESK